MIQFAEVAIGHDGGLSCQRCAQGGVASMRDHDEIATELAALAQGWPSGAPGPNVALVGVEPFAHPQLPQLVGTAVKLGCERIRLRTDAGALAQPVNAEGVVHAGVRHLEVVLLAATAESHDRLAARPGLFDAASAGVAAFVHAADAAGTAVFVAVDVPVCRHNVAELPQIAAASAALGAHAVSFTATEGLGARPEHAALLLAALETATVNRLASEARSWKTGVPFVHEHGPTRAIGQVAL